jgi:hypothetical protein
MVISQKYPASRNMIILAKLVGRSSINMRTRPARGNLQEEERQSGTSGSIKHQMFQDDGKECEVKIPDSRTRNNVKMT